MKSVLISIKPKYCELIASGKKTIEVRKTRPKLETPFKCFIYCTYGQENENYMLGKRGKVIGEFVCDWVTKITPHCDIEDFVNQYIHGYPAILGENDCLSFQEMKAYLGNKIGYDWHISDLKIYDKPKELSEVKRLNRTEENAPCAHTKWLYPDCKDCKACNLTRPPQSWCYVEEL